MIKKIIILLLLFTNSLSQATGVKYKKYMVVAESGKYRTATVTITTTKDSTTAYFHYQWANFKINSISQVVFCNKEPNRGVFNKSDSCTVDLNTTRVDGSMSIYFTSSDLQPLTFTFKRQ